ncbi:MAG TPA: helix-turn-helix transcriptional regulator, partial [Thermoanaerobaculia bacterium]|nr:helix-turn-helix transcriptional regulator [Thermoanaerobaculia bacterium]
MPRISRGPSTASDTDPSAVLRALSLMRSQASEPLTLRDLADAAYASPFHFLRTFRRATGLSPGRFLGALRLKSAVRLLMTTDLPVTEVCFASGYNSLGTFTRRFTEVMGLPPTLLRRGAGGAGAAGELRGRPPLPVAARPPAARTPTRPEGTAVRGSLHLSEEAEASAAEIYFVALFTAHYPQGIPVACTLLTAPGPFVLPPVPNGAFHLLAAAVTDPA